MIHPIYRVVSFAIVAPYTLRVTFDDTTIQVIDFSPILEGELYSPLRDVAFFNQVQLHHVSCLDKATREFMLAIFKREDLPRNVTYADGTEIDDSDMDHLNDVFMREMVLFDWQAGDLIILDNMLTSHARMPYSGPRRIAVAMGEIMGLDQA